MASRVYHPAREQRAATPHAPLARKDFPAIAIPLLKLKKTYLCPLAQMEMESP